MSKIFLRLKRWLIEAKALFGPSKVVEGIAIHGHQEFISLTTQALLLLKEKAPEAHQFIRQYIGRILLGTRSRVLVRMLPSFPAWCIVGQGSLPSPLIEYAAGLAHEAHHCHLYANYKKAHPKSKVPLETCGGEKGEQLCLDYECQVLHQLGADEATIQRARDSIKSRWWEIPADQQNW